MTTAVLGEHLRPGWKISCPTAPWLPPVVGVHNRGRSGWNLRTNLLHVQARYVGDPLVYALCRGRTTHLDPTRDRDGTLCPACKTVLRTHGLWPLT